PPRSGVLQPPSSISGQLHVYTSAAPFSRESGDVDRLLPCFSLLPLSKNPVTFTSPSRFSFTAVHHTRRRFHHRKSSARFPSPGRALGFWSVGTNVGPIRRAVHCPFGLSGKCLWNGSCAAMAAKKGCAPRSS